VLLLAGLVGDDTLARKLERGVENGNSIVALSVEDRRRIVSVLHDPPSGLAELRRVLEAQLKKHGERELQEKRSRLNHEMAQRRRDRQEQEETG
jgi:hypothetical protein